MFILIKKTNKQNLGKKEISYLYIYTFIHLELYVYRTEN